MNRKAMYYNLFIIKNKKKYIAEKTINHYKC